MADGEQNGKSWHDKHYKKLLVVPAILLILSVIYMGVFYSQTGDFMRKDISLTGGTSVTINKPIDADELRNSLESQLPDLSTREISDISTNRQKAIVVETTADAETARNALESHLGYELTDENSSFSFTSASLSQDFYKQLLIAILVAFVFMGIVVFILFRTTVPSMAVIISAFADIFMTLALVNLLGIKMSTAGIVAFLLLIGYSVDTDIMLTNRTLSRRDDTFNNRMKGAVKTGLTMTLTSLLAFGVALYIVSSFSEVLTKILTILVIGLGFDLINTWITNVSILKWYAEKKGMN
ncbi:MAG: protein translocase subunit SecF [Candidatus Pacearchaeota archaeon]